MIAMDLAQSRVSAQFGLLSLGEVGEVILV
jgi:hypothetical protein